LTTTGSDDVGIASATWQLDGGTAHSFSYTAGSFSTTVPVTGGNHSITVTVTDTGGLQAQKTVNFGVGTTTVDISGTIGTTTVPAFRIKGVRTHVGNAAEGLLINIRAANAIFDDMNATTYPKWRYPGGGTYSPSQQTTEFCNALPTYKAAGVDAVTISLMGAQADPAATGPPWPWDSSAFNLDGTIPTTGARAGFWTRLDQALAALDANGMVAMIQLLYASEINRITDATAVNTAADAFVDWMLARSYRNVLFSIGNEIDNSHYTFAVNTDTGRINLMNRMRNRLSAGGWINPLVGVTYGSTGTPSNAVVAAADWTGFSNNSNLASDVTSRLTTIRGLASYATKPIPIMVVEDNSFELYGSAGIDRYNAAVNNHAGTGLYIQGNSGSFAGGDYKTGFQSVPTPWGTLNGNGGLSGTADPTKKLWFDWTTPFAIGPDTTLPTLSVTTPAADGSVSNGTTTQAVAGTATDNIAIASVTVNGTAVAVGAGGAFSTSVPLVVGTNSIVVVATDTSGNTRTVTRTITRQSVPTTPPVLTVSTPADGTTYAAGTTSIRMTGTATDADGFVVSVTYSLDGGAPTSMPLTANAFDVTIPVGEGTHSLSFVATDDDGLTDSATVNFAITVTPPPPPPVPDPQPVTDPTFVDVLDVDPRPEFTITHSRHDGTNLGDSKGVDLRFGKFIGAPGYISYGLHRTDPLAPYSEPNAVDFSLQRNGVEILSGEIVQRDAESNQDLLQISGQDWMNYLDSLYLPFDPTNPKSSDNFTRVDTDLTDITEGLITKVLNSYNNTIDLSMNNVKTGIIQSQHFSAYDLNSLKSMIDTLAQQNPGFEWEITHDLQFIMYSPKRTDQSNFRVDSSNIITAHYGQMGVPAAWVYGRGQGAGSAQAIRRAGNAAVAQTYRDRVVVEDFGTVSSRKVLDNLTRQKVAELAKQKLEFWVIVKPRPRENVYASVFPGQYVFVDWQKPEFQANGYFRLMGYEAVVDAEGNEQITLNFNTDDASVD
jgi:hypothetical protein